VRETGWICDDNDSACPYILLSLRYNRTLELPAKNGRDWWLAYLVRRGMAAAVLRKPAAATYKGHQKRQKEQARARASSFYPILSLG
jgi:hypothetical protein